MIFSRTTNQSSGFFSLLLLLVLAFVMAYFFYQSHTLALGAAYYWYDQVGWVLFGLLPLSAFFILTLIKIITQGELQVFTIELRKGQQNIAIWSIPLSVRRDLKITLSLSPLLGFLGTIEGARQGLKAFYLVDGVENLMEVLAEFLKGASNMFLTSEWGLILVILALPLEIFLVWFPDYLKEIANSRSEEDNAEMKDIKSSTDSSALENA
ncbi:MAG: hypothetical protein AB2689_08815 [Candidatus Thiodiazotropha taylori]